MSGKQKEKFTPGPWNVVNEGLWYKISSEKKGVFISGVGNGINAVANASLIATAPEMFTLLDEIDQLPIGGLSGSMKDVVDWVNYKWRVNEVLKKARCDDGQVC